MQGEMCGTDTEQANALECVYSGAEQSRAGQSWMTPSLRRRKFCDWTV
jgi:hypothetical protein